MPDISIFTGCIILNTEKNTTGIIKESEFTTDGNGKAELEIILKDGMSCRICDLPQGAKYTVTVDACRMFIQEYSIEGSIGSQIAKTSDKGTYTFMELSTAKETVDVNDNDIRIIFTNTYSASDYVLPAAGFDDTRIMLAGLFLGMLLFGAVCILYSRKYGRESI